MHWGGQGADQLWQAMARPIGGHPRVPDQRRGSLQRSRWRGPVHNAYRQCWDSIGQLLFKN